jgi:hypothetical protein
MAREGRRGVSGVNRGLGFLKSSTIPRILNFFLRTLAPLKHKKAEFSHRRLFDAKRHGS